MGHSNKQKVELYCFHVHNVRLQLGVEAEERDGGDEVMSFRRVVAGPRSPVARSSTLSSDD